MIRKIPLLSYDVMELERWVSLKSVKEPSPLKNNLNKWRKIAEKFSEKIIKAMMRITDRVIKLLSNA